MKRNLKRLEAKRKKSSVVSRLTVVWREKNKRSNSGGDKWGKMDLHLEESRTLLVRIEGSSEVKGGGGGGGGGRRW